MTDTWKGTFTALVTPFRGDGAVDFDSLDRLVDFQVDGGVEGLIPCGTTGEGATLSEDEQLSVIERVLARARGRVSVLGGVGGNATDRVVAQARRVAELGVDGILSVVPYYNKPTQEGMVAHFSKVAEAVGAPILLYNVPGRTGANMKPAAVLRLAGHGNVKGVKEASGDLGQVMEILAGRPEGFSVLSGEDNLTFPMVALGGDGVVSVVSNEVPDLMSRMVRDALAGRLDEARKLHYRLLGLMGANFLETNPMPVKAALAMMGWIEESYRLPMVRMRAETRDELKKHLERLELLKGRAGAAAGGGGRA
jgi:4-hydroxy-tetrahydrodipicolinate synthase